MHEADMEPVTIPSLSNVGSTTFVLCVEYGRLEQQSLLMLRSLRENGGWLGQSRVVAVVGRFGVPLRASTVDAFRKLEVELVHDHGSNPTPWFNYANKIVAVGVAEKMARTDTVTWLDSDVLIAAEPIGLLLREGESFAGRCEFLPPAVVDEDSTHVPYWQQLCELLGTTFDALPSVEMQGHFEGRIRLFFNSGVFSWRRGSDFAPAYRRAFVRLLASRLAQHDGNFFNADQVILAPTLLANGLAWRHLDIQDHFMVFQGQLEGDVAAPDMAGAHLLHYSRSLQPPYRSRFLSRLASEIPSLHRQVIVWEQDLSTALVPPSATVRAAAAALRTWRAARWKLYEKRIARAPLIRADQG